MSRDDRGLRRCPRCGGGEWERGSDHVVLAPVTGEVVSFEAEGDTGRAWHCARCQVGAPTAPLIDALTGAAHPEDARGRAG